MLKSLYCILYLCVKFNSFNVVPLNPYQSICKLNSRRKNSHWPLFSFWIAWISLAKDIVFNFFFVLANKSSWFLLFYQSLAFKKRRILHPYFFMKSVTPSNYLFSILSENAFWKDAFLSQNLNKTFILTPSTQTNCWNLIFVSTRFHFRSKIILNVQFNFG